MPLAFNPSDAWWPIPYFQIPSLDHVENAGFYGVSLARKKPEEELVVGMPSVKGLVVTTDAAIVRKSSIDSEWFGAILE